MVKVRAGVIPLSPLRAARAPRRVVALGMAVEVGVVPGYEQGLWVPDLPIPDLVSSSSCPNENRHHLNVFEFDYCYFNVQLTNNYFKNCGLLKVLMREIFANYFWI